MPGTFVRQAETTEPGPPMADSGQSPEAGPTGAPADEPRPEDPTAPRWRLPLLLFVATCLSTFLVGTLGSGIAGGLAYAVSVMTILTAHELGHYAQARRYGVPASLPFFIPMPLTPFGTMGAIIAMRSRTADARALFDLAITGPLAGLVPAIALSTIGLKLSTVQPLEKTAEQSYLTLGEPLIFKLLSFLTLGPLPEDSTVLLHPIAFAGWVGIFITALNLLPIGQLDGGHILHTLLPRRAYAVSVIVLAAATAAVVVGQLWHWSLLIVILLFLGVRHPPTANGSSPLGRRRKVLGWLTLLFIFVGFTPTPIAI